MGVEHGLSSYITGASLSNDLSMKKILFLHGFFATGSCPMARALKEAFEGTAVVLTPDLPLHPKEALKEIRSIIDREQPDLLLGNSCGSFLAQMLAPVVGIPALLGNPYFMMTEFLKERIGEHEYKAPRRDGNQRLVIDEALIEEFAELEAVQFDHCNPYYKNRVWGLFGEQDTLAHFSPLFLEHYNQAFHFPGGHTPTEQEVKTWYAPLAQKMLMEFSAKEERYFQHFKGGKYKFIHSAFDSETQERMVVYQALYGDQAYWVRPEDMFFGKVTRDGRTFNRFTEIDKIIMETFNDVINSDQLVLVDFFATWCQPCKAMHPILEQVKSVLGDRIRIIKVDVDKYGVTANQYRIQSVPTLMLFRNGEVLWRTSGVVDKAELLATLDPFLK